IEEAAGRGRSRKEIDVDAADAVRAELDVASAFAGIPRRRWRLVELGDDRSGRDARGAFGEDARLRRADAVDIANRVHAVKPRLEILTADRDPAIFRHAAGLDNVGHTMLRHSQKQIVR